MTQIRDALHGYIELDGEEKQLVDSPSVQRLRRTRQLGFSSLAYPGATHTRFEHSLGVMHLAGKFADSLSLDSERRKELRVASLLHDTGHGPFSHASEAFSEKQGLSHEELSCQNVEKLEDLYKVDSRRVKKIIRGELEIGSCVAGDIDADRMDYLMRDAQATGLDHGRIDEETIIRLAEIDSRRLVFDYKALGALEALFTSRFQMLKSVYKHHTAEIAESMLERALDSFHEQKNSVGYIMGLDDYEAHNRLLASRGASRQLYSRIKDRRLYKRALVWDEDKVGKDGLKALENRIKDPRDVEAEIADIAGIEEHKVILDAPSTPKIKEMDVKVKKDGEIRDLRDLSALINSLDQAEWSSVYLGVYCPEQNTDEVADAARNVLEDYRNILGSYTG